MTVLKPGYFASWIEPKSAANTDINQITGASGTYLPIPPFNNATQTPSGHAFELDDTPTRERVRLQHRSKTFIEMHPNGDEVHKIYGDGYEITLNDRNILIGSSGKGNLNIEIHGDVNMNVVNGSVNQQIDGNYELHVKGNYSTVVEGLTSFVSQGDMDIKAGGALSGGLFVTPGDYVSIRGDLKVNGEITASKIFSKGRVDCLSGMSATSGGFTTQFGGITVGPLEIYPVPGTINCTGPINSRTLMSAPLITAGISSSLLSKDTINSIIRNVQIHIAPNGATSPPTTQEIGA
jgi:hypothetical protein